MPRVGLIVILLRAGCRFAPVLGDQPMRRPLTVFLCSTYADLAEERERVLDAIRRLQLQHDSMEFFGARANIPIETCLAEVRRSDVLVVVVGGAAWAGPANSTNSAVISTAVSR